jgi:hypothetical protein
VGWGPGVYTFFKTDSPDNPYSVKFGIISLGTSVIVSWVEKVCISTHTLSGKVTKLVNQKCSVWPVKQYGVLIRKGPRTFLHTFKLKAHSGKCWHSDKGNQKRTQKYLESYRRLKVAFPFMLIATS